MSLGQKAIVFTVAASPPDVRRGYAPPGQDQKEMGFALGSGYALMF